MALCILGKRGVFCGESNTSELSEKQAERLLKIAEEMLNEYNSEIVWLPNTSEIGVERDNLREAREEFDIDEIEDEMKEIWQRAWEKFCSEE